MRAGTPIMPMRIRCLAGTVRLHSCRPPLEQGIDVGHRLGRMLVDAVAAVDDGNAQGLQHLVHGVSRRCRAVPPDRRSG